MTSRVSGRPPTSRGKQRRESRRSQRPATQPGPARARPLHPSSPSSLRHIVDSLVDGVVVAGLDGRVLLFNPAAERLLGPGLADVPISEWTSVYGCLLPDMATACAAERLPLARALLGEVVSDFELLFRESSVPGGIWLSINSTPLRDSHGVIEGSVAVLRDVTRKKKGIDEIQFLSSAVEQTADSVLITDPNGRIEYVNPAFETITGYSRAEVLGQTPRILKSGVHPPELYQELWRTVVAGQAFRGTITDRRKNGELYQSEQTITPMKRPDGGVAHIVSVAKDITQLKKAAERESTLLLARSVQQRLYPVGSPRLPGFDIAGAAFVADVTGGDYFDFVRLPGDCLAIVIGDVSGHGVDSAMLMAETRAVLRSTAQATFEPSAILTIVNRVLVADTEDHRFVTLLIACLHGPTRTLTYASAGHNPGYVLDASGSVKRELPATGLPLGLFPDAVFETSPEIVLAPGQRLLLVTDGVTETQAPDGSTFGIAETLAVVRSRGEESSAQILDAIFRATRTFARESPQHDDVTIVICTSQL
jgi:phosphoserine phosphatase RsbU/P